MTWLLQPGEPPPWIRGSIEYTDFDRNQMWLTASRITTTCWFYLVPQTKEKHFILVKGKVTPTKDQHAEHIVLDFMEESLKSEENLLFFKHNPTAVLDVIFWMNNSPCKSCQSKIFSKLQIFKTILQKTQFRFIILFSSFYKKFADSSCLDRLNEFFEKLFTLDLIVIAGLLPVTRMVPKPNGKDVSAYSKREQNNLEIFRELLKKRKDQKINYHHDYTITVSDEIDNEEIETKYLLQMKSFKLPHFSICRSDKLHLAQLTPKFGKNYKSIISKIILNTHYRAELNAYLFDYRYGQS